LGQGGIYAVNRLLVWKDPAPRNVRYLAITTGFGNTGRWWLRDDRGTPSYSSSYLHVRFFSSFRLTQ